MYERAVLNIHSLAFNDFINRVTIYHLIQRALKYQLRWLVLIPLFHTDNTSYHFNRRFVISSVLMCIFYNKVNRFKCREEAITTLFSIYKYLQNDYYYFYSRHEMCRTKNVLTGFPIGGMYRHTQRPGTSQFIFQRPENVLLWKRNRRRWTTCGNCTVDWHTNVRIII